MNNKIADGKTILYPNSSGDTITAGSVVELATHCAVTVADIADGDSGAAEVTGVYELAAETGVAWDQGDDVYWDGTKLTKTSTDNTPCGKAHEAKASAAATAKVRLIG